MPITVDDAVVSQRLLYHKMFEMGRRECFETESIGRIETVAGVAEQPGTLLATSQDIEIGCLQCSELGVEKGWSASAWVALGVICSSVVILLLGGVRLSSRKKSWRFLHVASIKARCSRSADLFPPYRKFFFAR